jgi:hypothetical protein
MPSFDHEILVDLFREDGRLAAELLRRCAGIAVKHARVKGESIDLSQVVSTEYRADNVAVLYDRDGRAVTGVIVEVQLYEDPAKLRAWPVYVAALRARLRCPAVLLVIAPEPAIARWARRPIELGHPGFRLTPLVISFADVPRVCDRDAASQLPQLAVLSVMAHRELEIAEIAIQAIARLPEDQVRLYSDVILSALPAEFRRILEARMQRYEYQSDFARKYYGQGMSEGLEKGRQEGKEEGRQEGKEEGRQEGKEEGRQEGKEEGRQEGKEEGREEGLRAAVVALARTKLKTVSADDLAKIAVLTDLRVLIELVTALGQARTAFGARGALARALNR